MTPEQIREKAREIVRQISAQGLPHDIYTIERALSEVAEEANKYCRDSSHRFIPPNCETCGKPLDPLFLAWEREMGRAEAAESALAAMTARLADADNQIQVEAKQRIDVQRRLAAALSARTAPVEGEELRDALSVADGEERDPVRDCGAAVILARAYRSVLAEVEALKDEVHRSHAEFRSTGMMLANANGDIANLTAEVEALKKAVTKWSDDCAEESERADAARAEVARLEGVVEKAGKFAREVFDFIKWRSSETLPKKPEQVGGPFSMADYDEAQESRRRIAEWESDRKKAVETIDPLMKKARELFALSTPPAAKKEGVQ